MDINFYLITEIEKLGQPPSGHSSKHHSNGPYETAFE